MTWLRHTRPVLLVVGGLLVIGSLFGARLLATGTGDGPKTANPTNGKTGSGPVVIGFVDSDPSPVAYGLPPVLQSGQIVEVCVKEGQAVEVGADLFKFDTSLQTADLRRAESLVGKAKAEEGKARGALKAHEQTVALQTLAVSTAKFKFDTGIEVYNIYEKALREGFLKQQGWDKLPQLTPTQQQTITDQVNSDPKRLELQRTRDVAEQEWKYEKAKLDEVIAAKATRLDPILAEATAGVEQADAEVAKAKKAIELCTVTAKTAGVVEQILVREGAVLGISTRTPVLWLVPAGPRVVRAEVEAEFAHRITPEMIGRPVTVYDHTDPKLTYRGTLLRVSGSYLPKRSAGENLLGTDTRVLEAVVHVADPAPAGLPPLRVGQKVKVNFGQ